MKNFVCMYKFGVPALHANLFKALLFGVYLLLFLSTIEYGYLTGRITIGMIVHVIDVMHEKLSWN